MIRGFGMLVGILCTVFHHVRLTIHSNTFALFASLGDRCGKPAELQSN